MVHRGFQVCSLGEIALRTHRMLDMVGFYRDILGLPSLPGPYPAGTHFFSLGGEAGSSGILALYDARLHPREFRAGVVERRTSSLHHLALRIPLEEQEALVSWYEANELEYHIETFDWIGSRGVFTQDPDGNTVELVAYDEVRVKPIEAAQL
ncbi:VOC family protein [Rhodobacteraceae bacterium RKSG542]|uniref:VOC family protein n=1 Tax=Pseudovibrio flavus TaxID=2529854 RepID=UPI0012BC5ECF|nr:VOC family protein [Pseudovibrio flavus]MTI16414.1 VOC family protein [Pseudovibrio flavus]